MKLLIASVVAAMLVLPARAEEKSAPAPAKSNWSNFLKNLKNSLSHSAVSGERRHGNTSVVAAVRGDAQDKKNIANPNETGIKGDAKSAKAKRERAYDDELAPSIDLLAKGKLEEGLKGLNAFKTAHPKYRVQDVDQAIEGAKAGIAEAAGTPAAPAADTAVKP